MRGKKAFQLILSSIFFLLVGATISAGHESPRVFLTDRKPDFAQKFIEIKDPSKLNRKTFDVFASFSVAPKLTPDRSFSLKPNETTIRQGFLKNFCLQSVDLVVPSELHKLHEIKGISYRLNNDLKNTQRIGLLAVAKSSAAIDQNSKTGLIFEKSDLNKFTMPPNLVSSGLGFQKSQAQPKSYNYLLHRFLNIDFGSWVFTAIDDQHTNIQRQLNVPPNHSYQLILTGKDIDKIQSIKLRNSSPSLFAKKQKSRETIKVLYSTESAFPIFPENKLILDSGPPSETGIEPRELIIFFKQGPKFLPQPIDIELRVSEQVDSKELLEFGQELQKQTRELVNINQKTNLVELEGVKREVSSPEWKIEYFLDLSSKRLEFDFNSTLESISFFTVSTNECLPLSQISLLLTVQPNFTRANKSYDLQTLKLGEWTNSGSAQLKETLDGFLNEISPEKMVKAIYLSPKESNSTIQPHSQRSEETPKKYPYPIVKILFSISALLAVFLLCFLAMQKRKKDYTITTKLNAFSDLIRNAWLTEICAVTKWRLKVRLGKITAQLEALECYLIADLNHTEVIAIIRETGNPRARLMERFELTKTQADNILNMQLHPLRRLKEKSQTEREHLTAEQEKLFTLISEEGQLRQFVTYKLQNLKIRALSGFFPFLWLSLGMLPFTLLMKLLEESVALTIYLSVVIGLTGISSLTNKFRWINNIFKNNRPSLVILYATIAITLLGTLAFGKPVGSFISSGIMIALLISCLDLTFFQDKRHFQTREQKQ